jgi:chaperonin GroES
MNVRPLGDKILVKRAEAQTKTESGIYLPETAKDKPKEGKVIAVGSGHLNKETGKYIPFSVKKGDRVIFNSYAGTEVKIDNEELLIMTEDDVLGVIEKD